MLVPNLFKTKFNNFIDLYVYGPKKFCSWKIKLTCVAHSAVISVFSANDAENTEITSLLEMLSLGMLYK